MKKKQLVLELFLVCGLFVALPGAGYAQEEEFNEEDMIDSNEAIISFEKTITELEEQQEEEIAAQAVALNAETLRKLAEQGNSDAQYNLGVVYYNGVGVPKDYEIALKWFLKAADAGDTEAQVSLGVMYSAGEGVEYDYPTAVEWYKKAAEQGNALAQYNLGAIYDSGREGVEKNIDEAFSWYAKAAEQGDSDALERIKAEEFAPMAANWYLREANGGDLESQVRLGNIYLEGLGIAQDYVQAHMWFNIAAANGHAAAAESRDYVEKLMTPQQVSQAQKRVREWQERRRGSTGNLKKMP